mmetsp:Transcript_23235/g.55992  ORF Transcript_23235/g.55992 Transcript_23235/m.55992 type:complete len:131 (-) Transcript_23235:574-966(-)
MAMSVWDSLFCFRRDPMLQIPCFEPCLVLPNQPTTRVSMCGTSVCLSSSHGRCRPRTTCCFHSAHSSSRRMNVRLRSNARLPFRDLASPDAAALVELQLAALALAEVALPHFCSGGLQSVRRVGQLLREV